MELPLLVHKDGPTIGIKLTPNMTFLDFILHININLPEYIAFPYVAAYVDKQSHSHLLITTEDFKGLINDLSSVARLELKHGEIKGFGANELYSNWFDVLIVGSGLAGLCTAYTLMKANKYFRIGIIEKERYLGGNSMKASSGISLIDTPMQRALGIKDSIDSFVNDTIASGKGKSNPKLVYTLAKGSKEAWNFLTVECGIDLSKVTQCGGHSIARTHRPKGTEPVGFVFVKTLLKKLHTHPHRVYFFTNCEAKAIMERSGVGGLIVEREGMLIRCRSTSVVISTGGFANDHTEDSLLKEYAPGLKDFPTTNGSFAQGRGIKIASKIGAILIDMNEIQLHPTGFIDPRDRSCKSKILAPELLRGVGGILINGQGKRFCNELGTRDYVTKEILKNCNKRIALLILGGKAPESFSSTFLFYVKRGLIKRFDSLKELCEDYKLPLDNLILELKEYNESKSKGKDKYGKVVFPSVIDPYYESCYYACEVTPSLHYTMGGLKIDCDGAVQGKTGVIRGLYAVGEATGGLHGKNRLVGNSLMECVVFGQRAGKALANYLAQVPKL